jgi:UDPglucose 6-dehydrogenase
LAHIGNDVTCYDADASRIEQLQRGGVPFFEPQLSEIVQSARSCGRLRFYASPSDALDDRDLVFIAVGTPVGTAGEADLTQVRDAARTIARCATRSLVVANKSTVPVETADFVSRLLDREGRVDFAVASNPEFLREGSAIHDFLHPDRIVIGTSDERARAVLSEVYATLDAPTVVVDVRTAEMIKYAANAFLAAKVSFANELANLCVAVGADYGGVLRGVALDPRIGGAFLNPGLGFGGSCLPKDVSALAYVARAHGLEPLLLDAVLNVNRQQICRAVFTLEAACGDLDGCRVAILGVAFKSGTDDVRESPALALARVLIAKGACVVLSDPMALGNAKHDVPAAACVLQPYDACAGASAVVVAADWPQYRELDWLRLAKTMRGNVVLDARHALDPRTVRAANLDYWSLAAAVPSHRQVA